MFLHSSCRRSRAKPKIDQGFTLIEMLVVVAIFVIMTAVLMSDFPGFRERAALQLIAQEIAVTIRQAQVYGIGTRGVEGDEFVSYGIYINNSNIPNWGDSKRIIFYADTDDTEWYSGGDDDQDTIIETFRLRGATIEVVCSEGDNTGLCHPNEEVKPIQNTQNNVVIQFERFYPEVDFAWFDNNTPPATAPSWDPSYYSIVIKSDKNPDLRKAIVVHKNGQIVVI